MSRAVSRAVSRVWGGLTAALCFGAGVLCAQSGDTRPPVAAGSVSGVVFDSLAGKPLAGATIELVNVDSLSVAPLTTVSDSLGRYLLAGVHAGRYLIGFLHPMADSLGVEAPSQPIALDGRSALRRDLFIPSALTLRLAICGAKAVADSDALILGFARRASNRLAIDSAKVAARWLELVIERGAVSRSMTKRSTVTPESGWFALCGAPSGGVILLGAAHGADTTVSLELEIPKSGFLRRDLYFGDERIASNQDTLSTDSVPRGVQVAGDGRITGTVVAAISGRPLGGARVSIANGPLTRADERGAFTLTDVPTGTRMMQVRAVAHYPISMPVDVVDGAAPLRIAMSTLEAVLDTVRVTARRTGSELIEFLSRKRSSGAGKFLTSEDIARRRPLETSDLFRTVAGVDLRRDRNGRSVITMRGGWAARCLPTFYLNGRVLRGLSAGDLNTFVRPSELVGVEVYNATTTPAQFSDLNGCGSIVFWTR